MRLKAIHFVNEPAVFGAIFAIIKPFLKEKLVKRVCAVFLFFQIFWLFLMLCQSVQSESTRIYC
jgi:hypothetical protein